MTTFRSPNKVTSHWTLLLLALSAVLVSTVSCLNHGPAAATAAVARSLPVNAESGPEMVLGPSDVPGTLQQISISAPAGGPYVSEFIDPLSVTGSPTSTDRIISVKSTVTIKANPQSANTEFEQASGLATTDLRKAVATRYPHATNIVVAEQPSSLQNADRQRRFRVTFAAEHMHLYEYRFRVRVQYVVADITVIGEGKPDGSEPSALKQDAVQIAQAEVHDIHAVMNATSTQANPVGP